MASKAFAVKGAAYVFGGGLLARSNGQLKAAPTLASGDFKVSKDGGAFANLATLPSVQPSGGVRIKIALSASEMDADEVVVTAIDGAGDEWHDRMWVIHTVANGYDDLSVLVAGDVPTANQNADALLKRDMSGVTGEAARSPLNALRFLRNKWAVSGSTLTVFKEDDASTAWTGTVSTDAGADPVTGSDPG